MNRYFHHIMKAKEGSTAVEFALVLPLFIIFLFGMIDIGQFMWTVNRAEKATQVGARYAAVTYTIPNGINSFDFTGTASLTSGDIVPVTAYSKMTCSKPGSGTETCSCASGGSCPWGTAVKNGAFGNLVTEIDKFLPETQAKNIQVDYIPSGLGYAGDPNGADISPIVTVTIKDLTFTPKILFGLATFNLPDISASLTMEDGVGSQSN